MDQLSGISHRRKRRIATMLDALVIAVAVLAGFVLFGNPDAGQPLVNSAFVIISVIAAVLLLLGFRVYRGIIRHLDLSVVRLIVFASGASAALMTGGVWVLSQSPTPSFLYFFAQWFLLVMAILGWRLVLFFIQRQSQVLKPNLTRVGIFGTGQASRALIKSLNLSDQYHPTFIFDDDPAMIGGNLDRLRVYSVDKLEWAMGRFEVNTVLFNAADAQSAKQRTLIRELLARDVTVRIQPSLNEVLRFGNEQSNLRNIDIVDLIGRNRRPSDEALLEKAIRGQNILVTGAAGSIGSELCRAILFRNPKTLFMLDNNETALKEAHQQIASSGDGQVQMILGSTLSESVLKAVFQNQIDCVFHCAAYKHVDMGEANPVVMVSNNVIGTIKMLAAAKANGVKNFVQISTDKAVDPTSIMGAAKRLCEMLVTEQAIGNGKSGMKCCSVRFGNVLETQGSVIPLFKRQILDGGPVTITDPRMKRYFMSVHEASDLILQASAMSEGGEVFTLDMGEPISIREIAETLITLAGFKVKTAPNQEDAIEIVTIGAKPGEKLDEQLIGSGEERQATEHPSVFLCSSVSGRPEKPLEKLDQLLHAVDQADAELVRKLLFELVS